MRKKVIVLLFLVISLYADYTQIKIREFINIVSTQNSINIVIDKNIDVEFDFFINQKIDKEVNIQVLRDLLFNNGYVLQEKESYYFITKEEELLINKMDIFHLDHANTTKAAAHVEKILKSYFESIKTVKTTANKKTLTPLEENKKNDGRQTSEEMQVSERFNFSVTPLDNKSIAVSYKDNFVPKVVNQILRAIDIEPKRIEIRCKIYEVNTKAMKEYGMQFGLYQDGNGFHINTNTHSGIITRNLLSQAIEGTITQGVPLSVTGMIKALEEQGNASIMAQPKILIYEGGQAYLNDGKSYPISTENTTTQNNQTTSTKTYTNVDTGITLALHFKEYRADNIYLSFSLKIDNVDSYNQEDSQIITTKRELRSDLKFKPGKEIDLAGLSRDLKSHSTSGIPLLMDIPWIGKLFQIETNNTDNSMIIIQLIAEVV